MFASLNSSDGFKNAIARVMFQRVNGKAFVGDECFRDQPGISPAPVRAAVRGLPSARRSGCIRRPSPAAARALRRPRPGGRAAWPVGLKLVVLGLGHALPQISVDSERKRFTGREQDFGAAAIARFSLAPLFRGERVGVRGSLNERNSRRVPLTRIFRYA